MNILTLSEAWLSDNITSEEIEIPNFNAFRLDRNTGQRSGGVAAYISEKLSVVRRSDLETSSIEGMWLELFFPKCRGILLGTYYRPSNITLEFFDYLGNTLELFYAENKEIIICGDFNCPLNNSTADSNTKELKSLLCSHGLSQIIESPKRVTTDSLSLIDLILTNVPDNIIKHSVIPLGLSDHDLVLCVRKINGIKFVPRIIHCRNYRNYSAETGGKFVLADQKIAGRRKHIVFAFKNKAESEQEAVLSNKFLLCIQMIYNLGLLYLKSIIHTLFWTDFFGI